MYVYVYDLLLDGFSLLSGVLYNSPNFFRYLWIVCFIQGLSSNSRTKVGATPWSNLSLISFVTYRLRKLNYWCFIDLLFFRLDWFCNIDKLLLLNH